MNNTQLRALGTVPHQYQRLAYELDLAKPIACSGGPAMLRAMVDQWRYCCCSVADALASQGPFDRAAFLRACGVETQSAEG